MQIAVNMVIGFRYRMRNGKGEILEDITEGSPVSYLHGSGNILPALEAQLDGLSAGDSKHIIVSGDMGFEGTDDEFSFDVMIDFVRLATDDEISLGRPKEEGEDEEDCGPDCIC
jgi:FKBP-type peptidyl-prolyl cis-trans isomerase SlyD